MKREYYSGGFLVIVGLAVVVESSSYRVGSLAQTGPGYFPLAIGVGMVLVGLLLALMPEQKASTEELPQQDLETTVSTVPTNIKNHVRPWLAIISGIVSFIIINIYGGFIPAAFIFVFITALGDKNNSVRASALLAAFITLISILLFHFGLSLALPLWSWG